MKRQEGDPVALRSIRMLFLVSTLVVMACAPAAAPSGGSAFVQQDVQPASRAGAAFDSAGQPTAPQAGDAAGAADKTLVIGLGTDVKGFSLMNGNQQKYVEDLV